MALAMHTVKSDPQNYLSSTNKQKLEYSKCEHSVRTEHDWEESG